MTPRELEAALIANGTLPPLAGDESTTPDGRTDADIATRIERQMHKSVREVAADLGLDPSRATPRDVEEALIANGMLRRILPDNSKHAAVDAVKVPHPYQQGRWITEGRVGPPEAVERAKQAGEEAHRDELLGNLASLGKAMGDARPSPKTPPSAAGRALRPPSSAKPPPTQASKGTQPHAPSGVPAKPATKPGPATRPGGKIEFQQVDPQQLGPGKAANTHGVKEPTPEKEPVSNVVELPRPAEQTMPATQEAELGDGTYGGPGWPTRSSKSPGGGKGSNSGAPTPPPKLPAGASHGQGKVGGGGLAAAAKQPPPPTAQPPTAQTPKGVPTAQPPTAQTPKGASTAQPPMGQTPKGATMSQQEYVEALGQAFPGHHLDPVLRAVDGVGQKAAAAAVADPRFVQAVQSGNWTLAGTLFHSHAAQAVRGLPAGALPPGWSMQAEHVVQAGPGGSRSDVLVHGPGGQVLEFDWKTTGKSALSSGSRAQMKRHSGQISANIGGTLLTQQSRSWEEYVRPLMPNAPWR